jgi:uroporphyrinogen decarboxylase
MEQVLLDLIDCNPVYLEIMQARFEFYYDMHEKMLQATDGLLDFTHVGDDLGNQLGAMISMDIFDKHFALKYEKYFNMVHSYGARTMMHMCGCVYDFLPRLMEIGLDVYDVVQPTNEKMDIANLMRNFGHKLNFCGTMCVQSTLAWGTTDDVRQQVRKRLELFPKGGLFLGPTHAIQVGTPLENILAMYREASSLNENIDENILPIKDTCSSEEINMSKLF